MLTACLPLFAQQDLSPAGVMMSHTHPKGGWMFNYTLMHMEMRDNFKGDSKIGEPEIFDNYFMAPTQMKMDMHMLMAMYGITGRFSLMLMSNYTFNSMTMNPFSEGSHIHNPGTGTTSAENMRMVTSGFGDTKVYGLYKFLNGEKSTFAGSLGVNIPTGNFMIKGNPHGSVADQRYPYMMQTGTGSLDFSPGLMYLSAKHRITWSAQMQSIIRPFDNSIGYHFGNEYSINMWAGYKMFKFASASIRLEGIHTEKMSGKDSSLPITNEPGDDHRNYGGEKINSYLGLNFFVNKGILKESKIALEAGLPFYQNYRGIQQGNNGTVYVSYTISL